jgi:hypothetical protein
MAALSTDRIISQVPPGPTRSGRWRRPTYGAAALEMTRHEGDGSRHHRLSAVIPPAGRWATMFDGPDDDDSVRSLGAWLALQADIPFTDHTRQNT